MNLRTCIFTKTSVKHTCRLHRGRRIRRPTAQSSLRSSAQGLLRPLCACHQTQLSADFCVSWQRAHHERRHLANHLSRTATKHLNRNFTGKHRPMGGQPEGLCCPDHRCGRAGGHICRPWCFCHDVPAEVKSSQTCQKRRQQSRQ